MTERDYAKEADAIIVGDSTRLPERAHLMAMAARVLTEHERGTLAARNEQFAKTLLAAVMLNNHLAEMLFTRELILGVDGQLVITPFPDGSVSVTYTPRTADPPVPVPGPRRVM